MAVDNSFIVKKIIERPSLIMAYSAFTNMPYVVCDPETFNDQVYVFENEELFQGFAKPRLEEKVFVRGIKYENKNFLMFFSSLYMMGVNEIVLVDEEGTTNIELEHLVRRPDYSKLAPKDVPLTNPTLVLTGMYFKQEVIRQQVMLAEAKKNDQPDPTTDEIKSRIRELDEELAHDLSGSRYLVAAQLHKEGDAPAQVRFPILKMKNEESMLPLFTDPLEMQKFTKNDPSFRPMVIPFEGLLSILPPNINGFILNPLGFNVVMPTKMINGIAARFGKKMVQNKAAAAPGAAVQAPAEEAPAQKGETNHDSKVTNFSDIARKV